MNRGGEVGAARQAARLPSIGEIEGERRLAHPRQALGVEVPELDAASCPPPDARRRRFAEALASYQAGKRAHKAAHEPPGEAPRRTPSREKRGEAGRGHWRPPIASRSNPVASRDRGAGPREYRNEVPRSLVLSEADVVADGHSRQVRRRPTRAAGNRSAASVRSRPRPAPGPARRCAAARPGCRHPRR